MAETYIKTASTTQEALNVDANLSGINEALAAAQQEQNELLELLEDQQRSSQENLFADIGDVKLLSETEMVASETNREINALVQKAQAIKNDPENNLTDDNIAELKRQLEKFDQKDLSEPAKETLASARNILSRAQDALNKQKEIEALKDKIAHNQYELLKTYYKGLNQDVDNQLISDYAKELFDLSITVSIDFSNSNSSLVLTDPDGWKTVDAISSVVTYAPEGAPEGNNTCPESMAMFHVMAAILKGHDVLFVTTSNSEAMELIRKFAEQKGIIVYDKNDKTHDNDNNSAASPIAEDQQDLSDVEENPKTTPSATAEKVEEAPAEETKASVNTQFGQNRGDVIGKLNWLLKAFVTFKNFLFQKKPDDPLVAKAIEIQNHLGHKNHILNAFETRLTMLEGFLETTPVPEKPKSKKIAEAYDWHKTKDVYKNVVTIIRDNMKEGREVYDGVDKILKDNGIVLDLDQLTWALFADPKRHNNIKFSGKTLTRNSKDKIIPTPTAAFLAYCLTIKKSYQESYDKGNDQKKFTDLCVKALTGNGNKKADTIAHEEFKTELSTEKGRKAFKNWITTYSGKIGIILGKLDDVLNHKREEIEKDLYEITEQLFPNLTNNAIRVAPN